jgi:hypothetical protein
MNISRSSLVTVSGEVVNGSGELVPTVIVKIWEDAKLSDSGRFAIPGVKRGRVPVEVVDQETGRQYVLASPTINGTGRIKNLRIVVDDPLDVGSLDARVFWHSIPAARMGDSTALRSGKIQLIRNGLIEKTIDLEKTAGRVNIPVLQAGNYTVKYFTSDNREKSVYLSNGGYSKTITIEKGKKATNDIRANDMSKFTLKITSNDKIVKCQVPYWGHLYVTTSSGVKVDYAKPPKNCEVQFTARPGRFYLQMLSNYGYNRTVTPAYVDVPPAVDGAVYEIKLW